MNEFRFEYWTLPAELELLLKIVLRQKVASIPGGLDWDRFEKLLSQHRVQPLLIRGLRSLPAQTVEAYPVLKKYLGMQNKYAMESFTRLQALAEVARLFAANGIRLISMKGPLLSMELYGDPSLRTSRDLDLMVAQEDLKRAGELLASIGYRPEEDPFRSTPLRRKYLSLIELEKHEVYLKGDVCLELHWRSNFQAEQSFDALWDSREERMVLGQQIAVMGADERYPALFIHAAEHGFLRLRWLLDLYELQKKPGFSWERVYGSMAEQGIGELLLETMLVMYRLDLPGLGELSFGGVRLMRQEQGVVLTVSDELRAGAEKAKRLSDAVYPLLLREVKRSETEWKCYDRLLPTCINEKTPLQWVLIACGPSIYDFQLIDLPDWLFWAYFIIRPVHWLWRKLFGGKK